MNEVGATYVLRAIASSISLEQCASLLVVTNNGAELGELVVNTLV